MGERAIKQPNGLYARFSEIVDDFTHINCSREELVQMYTEKIKVNSANGKLDRADANPNRFDEAIDIIKSVHGEVLAEDRRKQLSKPHDEFEKAEYSSEDATKEHIKNVSDLLLLCEYELVNRGILHDASKLDDIEKEIFDVYTPKLKNCTFGSEEYKSYLNEMKEALKHHYQNNRHHPQHFENGILGMNLFDVIEMLCDWYAASKRHENGDIKRSIAVYSQKFSISAQLQQILTNTIDTILELERK